MKPARRSIAARAEGREQGGFSIVEMLLVLAIMGIFITFAGPAFTQAYRAYRVRSSASELTLALRAARQVAVSTRAASSLVVDTANRNYSWTDARGRVRTWTLPTGVEFVTVNPATVTFATNGTVTTGTATIALQGTVAAGRADRWTLDLNTVGRVTSTYTTVVP